MPTKRQGKIAGLLQRYKFEDLAEAIATPKASRTAHLTAFVDRERKGRWKSYKGFRAAIPDIVGVQRGLDPGMKDIDEICEGMRGHRDDLGFNVEAARVLFDYVRKPGVSAYDDHPRYSLKMAPDRRVTMDIQHHIVEGERGAFQYVYPRRTPLEGRAINVLLSLMHVNHVQGDYAEFDVEMIDLSCDHILGPMGGLRLSEERNPQTHRLEAADLISREELNEEASNVYEVLLSIHSGV
ncbi:MAG: hypothetical protein JJ894_03100 [Dinoroseobacter sp.]|nr:hypothetical protein [Dinoroseobacter sp.]